MPRHQRPRGHQFDTLPSGRGADTPTFTQVKLRAVPLAHLRMHDTWPSSSRGVGLPRDVTTNAMKSDGANSEAPARAGLVLVALIVVAGVANLNLSVANVALPDIGKHFDSSQTALDLIAVGYSLGLACSVLWLGALGDRYGRKMMLVLGTALAVPMSLLAAYAPSDTVLFV